MILLPLTLLLLLTIFIFQDTPYSLLKSKSAKEICESLNRIGRINKGIDNLVSEEEVIEFLEEENKIGKIS